MKMKRHKPQIPKRWIVLAVSIIAVTLLVCAYVHYHNGREIDHSSQQSPRPKLAKKAVDGTKKTPEEKDSYTVAPNRPRQLIINKLGINVNILPMGILKDGSLEAPKTAWDVGWYDQSALPGSDSGALLIDGHVNDALGTPGVFYAIRSLSPGDTLQIQRGDKQLFKYRVVDVEQKPINDVDMAKMLQSATPGNEGLNLITCGGQYDYGRQTYKDRVLVFAVRQHNG